MYHIVRKGKKHKVIIIRGAGIQMMRMMEEQEKEPNGPTVAEKAISGNDLSSHMAFDDCIIL